MLTIDAVAILRDDPVPPVEVAVIRCAAMLTAKLGVCSKHGLAFVVVVAHVVAAFVMGLAEPGELAALLDTVPCTVVLLAREMLFTVSFLFVTTRGATCVGASFLWQNSLAKTVESGHFAVAHLPPGRPGRVGMRWTSGLIEKKVCF